MMKKDISISYIGSGNVATHLALAFYKQGYTCRHVISRKIENAEELAKKVNAQYHSNLLKDLDDQSDFYMIAVPDDAIQYVLDQLPFCLSNNQILLHTSGTFDEECMLDNAKYFGCFYPLQSFSKKIEIDVEKTPVLISTNDAGATSKVELLAKSISNRVLNIQHAERQKIHVAAVIANNFTNHLLTLTKNYCIQNHLDFTVLWPLVEEGLVKSKKSGPENAQTGPARRNDKKTIQKHLQMLEGDENLQNIYKMLTVSIQHFYSKI